MNKKLIFFFLVILSLNFVSSQGIIGVSPGNYFYKDVLRGGYAERSFTVSFSGDEPVSVTVQPIGEVASWVNLSANQSEVSKNSPFRFISSIEPPIDIPNGNYTGVLRIRTSQINPSSSSGKATGNIIASLDLSIVVEVTDKEIISCQVSNFLANSAEKGDDLEFGLDFINNGNIRLRPRVVVDLWDQAQTRIVKTKEFSGKQVLPTKTESLLFYMPTDELEIDQYWVDIHSLDCFDSSLLTVDVLQPGALKSQGLFKEIIALPFVDVGETTQIMASFENIGEKEVDAQFKGQITFKDRIVQVLESEVISVKVGEISNFTFFFTPEKAGDYLIDGRFFYDKKRTFEASKMITAVRGKISIFRIMLYIIILFVAFYLYYRIRKEAKSLGGLK